MEYSPVKTNKNGIIDEFISENDLFALSKSPFNILFIDNFEINIRKYEEVFTQFGMKNNTYFSCKANKSFAFMKIASEQGCGIEVASYYELKDALKYTNKVIASGPAKSREYLELAINNKVIISIDDIEELKDIINFNSEAKVLLRISDLLKITSRFGINISQLDECFEILENSKLELLGFSFHINNYNLVHRIQAIEELLNIVKKKALKIKYIDIGGGFPINYCSKDDYENFIKKNNDKMYFRNKNFKDFYPYYNSIADENSLQYILENISSKLDGIQIIIEPGRSLLNNCGISVYEIKYIKHLYNGDNLIISNGNINSLSEQWFNTDYLIEPELYKRNKKEKLIEPILASIGGNLCLEQDMITWRKIKFDYQPERGDFLIYHNTAGYQMDSNESKFHKIPLVKKIVVTKINGKYVIKGDEEYDSK